jgi:KilA-N domain
MIPDIAIKQIQGNFWLGAYGELRLPMMMDCGFVNATTLCANAGKRYDKWARLQSSTQLMNTLKEMLGTGEVSAISSGDEAKALRDGNAQIWASVCKSITTENFSPEDKLISGTYVHPDLIPSIAGWISPRHQIMTNRLRMAFDAWQYNKQLKDVC